IPLRRRSPQAVAGDKCVFTEVRCLHATSVITDAAELNARLDMAFQNTGGYWQSPRLYVRRALVNQVYRARYPGYPKEGRTLDVCTVVNKQNEAEFDRGARVAIFPESAACMDAVTAPGGTRACNFAWIDCMGKPSEFTGA